MRQARVIHSCNPEWTLIKEATEKAQAKANSEGDEVGEVTCSELLEALELSRCLLLMRLNIHLYNFLYLGPPTSVTELISRDYKFF